MKLGKKTAVRKILISLKKAYPEATTELNWKNPFELLIVTILSAQTTDKKVNEVAPALFEKYPTPQALAKAKSSAVESIVKPLGYFRQKTKTIINTAKVLVEQFNGEIPQNMDDMLKLPGVGRKTGSVVLSTAFNKQEGIAVDTHVQRVTQRLGLTNQTHPEKIERDLMKLVPKKDWGWFAHAITLHGRYVCTAKKPNCPSCGLESLCEKLGVIEL